MDGAQAARMYPDGNFYWIEIMGRLRPGVSMAQAQAVLAPRFHQWVATTATKTVWMNFWAERQRQ